MREGLEKALGCLGGALSVMTSTSPDANEASLLVAVGVDAKEASLLVAVDANDATLLAAATTSTSKASVVCLTRKILDKAGGRLGGGANESCLLAAGAIAPLSASASSAP